MKLPDVLTSSRGKGVSQKFFALFVGGTLLPLMDSLGVNHDIVVGLGQALTLLIGVLGARDTAAAFANGKSKPKE